MAQTMDSRWDPDKGLLVTRLRGQILPEDVRRWRDSLERELDRIEGGTAFKILVDLHGYEPGSLEAHKEMRVVIPLTLARFGFRTALFNLFDPVDLPLQKTRGITCIAVAHVHHDAHKMGDYDRTIGRGDERFFTDYARAEAWVLAAG